MTEKEIKDGEIVETTETEEADDGLQEKEEGQQEEIEADDPEKKDDEPWMKAEEDDQDVDPSKQVPVAKFVGLKKKLRGKIGERDTEISALKAEVENLKASVRPAVTPDTIKRPQAVDFETDEAYEVALDEYIDKRMDSKLDGRLTSQEQHTQQQEAQLNLNRHVDAHYTRAEKLLTETGIQPDTFKDADVTVRQAVEAIRPNFGDAIVDQIISNIGEGSEKVMYFLGRNANALTKFQGLLSSDPSGIQAAVFLGQEKQRLTNTKINQPSNAPAPGKNVKGDAVISANERALKKTYDEAHGKSNIQAAYNVKKKARAAGVDVASW